MSEHDSNLPEWAQEALARAEACPELDPYVADSSLAEDKGEIVISRPFPLKKAWAAENFIESVREDVAQLSGALAIAVEALQALTIAGDLNGLLAAQALRKIQKRE